MIIKLCKKQSVFSLHISDVGRKNWKVPLGGEN